jgi:hypothetical protein
MPKVAQAFQPVLAQAKACGYHLLVPKFPLGNAIFPKDMMGNTRVEDGQGNMQSVRKIAEVGRCLETSQVFRGNLRS